MNLMILDDTLTPITTKNLSSLSYPSNIEKKYYLKNDGDTLLENISLSVQKGLSVMNFSSPPLIREAYIDNVLEPLYFNYAELLFTEDNKCMDIFNAPGKLHTVELDPDGFCRNIFKNIKIKFHHMRQNGNSRFLISDAVYYTGVSKDSSGSPEAYQDTIVFQEIEVGETIPFWFMVISREGFDGFENPFVFNLLVRGVA